MKPCLYIVVPCFNEESVLPVTVTIFVEKIKSLIDTGAISENSRVMFVNDGSSDDTWGIICEQSEKSPYVTGISLARNYGHQKALLAGLSETVDKCDITISMDCDGQDDINAVDEMIQEYLKGNEIVYGIRKERKKDTFFKRHSAQFFYKFLAWMGSKVVYNHADYRLMSNAVVKELMNYKEVNLYLRGLIPLLGYKSSSVYYSRAERIAGKTHYPFRKMLNLALDGITSLSVRPLRIIISMGLIVTFFCFIGVMWTIVVRLTGYAIDGWASSTCIICFLGGIQLVSIGVVGEYVGKIYMETKSRPRFNITRKTYQDQPNKNPQD